jgi:hypothetical protein
MDKKPKPSHMLLLFVGALFVGGGLASSSLPQTRATGPEGVGKYTGPGSCASTSCHGSVSPRAETGVLQNEYSTWIVKDKHSKSYGVLTEKVGERMAGLLGLGKAETAPRCLACHALDVPASDRARTFDLSDGVSCESCHGPAAGWLGPHTERDWSHQKSVALGMYDTRDLVKRTEKCLSCHLGNADKFVDHEMIAAGHPDLFSEMQSFSAVMPRHWKESGQSGHEDPWYAVRELTTGQAVQVRESMTRLAARGRGKEWPEYSELQCEACHHSLTPPDQSWRQARGYAGRRPGNPPWNASRFTVFHYVVHELDPQDAAELDTQFSKLAQLMSQLNPDRGAVQSAATSAAQLADMLVSRIVAATYDSALALRLSKTISADADAISDQGEQSAAQAAMALQSLVVAYDRDGKLPNSSERRAAISGLFQQLNNVSSYDPARFAHQMRQVNALLP